ncbi:MAG: hypothetical protein IH991_14080 [Planctomycetes bacterium]|nr:hypothetical protein [Planctomycetota bacterium]
MRELSVNDAIASLRAFAEQHALVEDGATLSNATGVFESRIHVEEDEAGPIQAWINRADSERIRSV